MAEVSPGRARVTIRSRSLWQLRLARETPRVLLGALALFGLAASARFAIAPPSSGRAVVERDALPLADRAAEGYAVLFARRYLSWNSADPQAGGQALQGFIGEGMEPDGGVILPPEGGQTVEWAEVVQAREPVRGQHLYTIAAQLDPGGLEYLTVGLTRTADGALTLSGYPAFVGPPALVAATAASHLRQVSNPVLEVVVRRGLANYLSGSLAELDADLASGARVSLPLAVLQLQDVERMSWTTGPGSLLAIVRAVGQNGVRYTLSYEVEVVRSQGRWEILAIQMDPDA
jgi:hypothetical protein